MLKFNYKKYRPENDWHFPTKQTNENSMIVWDFFDGIQ